MNNTESTKKLTTCEAYTRQGAWWKVRNAFKCRFEYDEEASEKLGLNYYKMLVGGVDGIGGEEIGEVYDIKNDRIGDNRLHIRYAEDNKIKEADIYIMADYRIEAEILSLKCDKTNNECEIEELKAEVENLKGQIAELENSLSQAQCYIGSLKKGLARTNDWCDYYEQRARDLEEY